MKGQSMNSKIILAFLITLVISVGCTKSNTTYTPPVPDTTATVVAPSTPTPTTSSCGTLDVIKFDIVCREDVLQTYTRKSDGTTYTAHGAENIGDRAVGVFQKHMHCGGTADEGADSGVDASSGKAIYSKYWYSPEINTDSKLKVRFTPRQSQGTPDSKAGIQMYTAMDIKIKVQGKSIGFSTGLTTTDVTSKVVDLSSQLQTGKTAYKLEVGEARTDFNCAQYCSCGDQVGWGVPFWGSDAQSHTYPMSGLATCQNMGRVTSLGVEVCKANAMWLWSGRCPVYQVFDGTASPYGQGAVWSGMLEVETNETQCL